MQKIIAILLVLAMTFSLCACSGSGTEAEAEETRDDGIVKIAIVQQLTHASLNEIRQAIVATLKAHFAEYEEEFVIDTFNGEDDTEKLNQIGEEIMANNYDLVIPIATRAAHIIADAVHGEIPVVYAAVSDPDGEGLTGMVNVTGTSDALDTQFIIDMIFIANPKVKSVGLLYSKQEHNDEKAISTAKEYLDSLGVAYVDMGCETREEIIEGAKALVGQVQAVFTPTDNEVMAVEAEVAEILNAAKIPQYAGADSFVRAGAFATCCVDYTELGEHTAQRAIDALHFGNLRENEVMDSHVVTVNTKTAHADNLDPGVFSNLVEIVKMVGSAMIGY